MKASGRMLALCRTMMARQGGWGSSAGAGGGDGGGWGSTDNSNNNSGGGGWGSGGGGWGSTDNNNSGNSSGGGWGSPRNAGRERRSAGGGGFSNNNNNGGGGGGWSSGDGGWGGASTPQRRNNNSGRGSFTRGRQSGNGWGGGGGGGGAGNAWGQPAKVDEEAWSSAPPSFAPPVRRVDPLTLTAVEVMVDGVKKLVGQRVQLSGLSEETSWQTLKDHLRQAAEVTFCKMYPHGRAMVEFATPEEAARAITELQASELEGSTIFMREDREDVVLVHTRRKIREAREAQLRARKAEVEQARRAQAAAESAAPAEHNVSSPSGTSTPPPK